MKTRHTDVAEAHRERKLREHGSMLLYVNVQCHPYRNQSTSSIENPHRNTSGSVNHMPLYTLPEQRKQLHPQHTRGR